MSRFIELIVRLLKFFLEFSLGIFGYVIAGIGFILLIVGFKNYLWIAILGLFFIALGVYLFFNIDSSLSKFLGVGKKSE
jgi:hypothetical protein